MPESIVIGMAAHVDAGKTTLTESMLYLSGTVRKQGRVDRGDTFLDTEAVEKERGITVFSKQARLTWKKRGMILLDTPGHTDFSGETERAARVMDAAVLLISGPEGVQSHTLTLWKLLERFGVPVIVFVNKMDRCLSTEDELLSLIGRKLSDRIVRFSPMDGEMIAMCDENCLDVFLREGSIPDNMIQTLVRNRKLFPCFFGSALRGEGTEELMNFLSALDLRKSRPDAFGATVYKIARDPKGARLTFMKITGGVLRAKDLLTRSGADESGPAWQEKAAELRLYSGARYETVQEAAAGEICCAVGLGKTAPGDRLVSGNALKDRAEGNEWRPGMIRPCYACSVTPVSGGDKHELLRCLRIIEEEEPLLRVEYAESSREIRVQSMGRVYLEVLARQLKDRFGLEVSYGESSVVYRETISNTVEGVGHYEPLRHYAEVHLILSPLPRGSGIQIVSDVSQDDLAVNWQRLIMTHLRERSHPGVLTGAPITDIKITLAAGKAHLKHTEGGDFRQATYRAVRQGLMKADSVLLEPWIRAEITVPEGMTGRIMNDISMAGGTVSAPESAGDGLTKVSVLVSAGAWAPYERELQTVTRGQGTASAVFDSWRPCADQEASAAKTGYDPERDTMNPPDSVFCSHGAGVTVSWRDVERYMHLPSCLDERRAEAGSDGAKRAAGGKASGYRGTAEEDEALRAIFEKTYGAADSRRLLDPVRKTKPEESPKQDAAGPGEAVSREILLVDGYNVIFAWDEWKDLTGDDIAGARQQLIELMCNYAGMTGRDVILVFDGYRVKGNPGEAEKVNNIFVVYTKEAQTADAYIEKTTLLARGKARVRVVTSDRPEQLIAAGNAAMRTSAREFHGEVAAVQGSIEAFIRDHNRKGGSRAIEQAYKAAWIKKRE